MTPIPLAQLPAQLNRLRGKKTSVEANNILDSAIAAITYGPKWAELSDIMARTIGETFTQILALAQKIPDMQKAINGIPALVDAAVAKALGDVIPADQVTAANALLDTLQPQVPEAPPQP